MGSQELVITDVQYDVACVVKTPRELWDEIMAKVTMRGAVTLTFHENEGDIEVSP